MGEDQGGGPGGNAAHTPYPTLKSIVQILQEGFFPHPFLYFEMGADQAEDPGGTAAYTPNSPKITEQFWGRAFFLLHFVLQNGGGSRRGCKINVN
jgi:hypothetical protein